MLQMVNRSSRLALALVVGTAPGRPTWQPVPKIGDVKAAAFYATFQNVERCGKLALFALDVSGSMGGSMIAGTKGTLVWRQEDPECLTILLPGQPDKVYWRGAVSPGDGFLPKDVPADLMAEPTIPPGHPEAFHDAFARLHRCFEADVRLWKAGKAFKCDGAKYANVEDGWMGIAFIETCVKSSQNKGAWTPMPKAI